MGLPQAYTKQLAAASSNAIATSQSASAGVALTLTANPVVIDTKSAANSAIGRRVVIAYTGTDTSFAIVGTNAGGAKITDTAVGSGGSAVSNMDFVTVISITPVGGGLTGVTAGTNSIGSSQWWTMNWHATSDMNIGIGVEVVTGTVVYTIEHTYDDPNNLQAGALYPFPFPHPVLNNANGSLDGAYTTPVAAIRVTILSGVGEIRVRQLQSSIG